MKKVIQNKHIDVIGFPMDLGADRRGVDMGASALRIAGIEEKLKNLGYRVTDAGDIAIRNQERQKVKNEKLKYLSEIVKTSEVLARKVEKSLDAGNFPRGFGVIHAVYQNARRRERFHYG